MTHFSGFFLLGLMVLTPVHAQDVDWNYVDPDAIAGEHIASEDAPAEVQTPEDEVAEVAREYLDHRGMITCEFAENLREHLLQKSEDEIRAQVADDLQLLKERYQQEKHLLNRSEKRLVKKQIHYLENLYNGPNPHKALTKLLVGTCKAARATVGFTVRTTAHVIHTLELIAKAPVKFFYKFGRGVVTGKSDRPLEQLGLPRYHDSMVDSVADLIIFYAAKAVLGAATPATGVAMIIPMINKYAARVCVTPNPNNPHEVRFCEVYIKEHNLFEKFAAAGDKGGAKIHQWFEKHVVLRPRHRISERVCGKKWQHQYKIAERVIKRRESDLKEDYPELKLEVIRPTEDACVAIQVNGIKPEQEEVFKNDTDMVEDGIELKFAKDVIAAPVLSDEWNNANLCDHLVNDAMDYHWEDSLNAITKNIDAAMGDASSYPKDSEVILKNENVIKMPLSDIGNLHNVVLIQGLSDSQEEEFEKLGGMAAHKADTSSMKQFRKQIKKMAFSGSLQACRDLQKNYEFSYDEYKKLEGKLANNHLADLVQEEKLARRVLKMKVMEWMKFRFLKMKWEIVYTNRTSDIQDYLTRPDITNVLIVAHGSSGGQMVDANFDIIPSNTFKTIAPNILTVSIFDCLGGNLNQVYHVTEALASNPSYYKMRHFIHVDPALTQSLGGGASLLALRDFMFNVDQIAYLTMKGNLKAQAIYSDQFTKSLIPETSQCFLQLGNFQLAKGAYSINLNQNLIGVLRKDTPTTQIDFDCSLLIESANSLYISNINIFEQAELTDLDSSHWSFVINKDGVELKPKKVDAFKFRDTKNINIVKAAF